MIKSMTGYGKAETLLETGKITVEVRSLNGKTADISIKTSILPKDKEMSVRQKIAAELTRGNIDFFITFEPNAAESAKKINMDLAMEYYQQIDALGSRLGAHNLWSQNPNDLLAMILRMPEVMDAKKQDVITDDNWPAVETCIDEALRKSGMTRSDIDYLDILHIKRSGHKAMLADLGLTEDQSIYLEDYGHIGQIDQILSLELALKEGKVKDGSTVCMIAAGIGYTWAANIIKWGEC